MDEDEQLKLLASGLYHHSFETKVEAIKEVRQHTRAGLKHSKEFVDNVYWANYGSQRQIYDELVSMVSEAMVKDCQNNLFTTHNTTLDLDYVIDTMCETTRQDGKCEGVPCDQCPFSSTMNRMYNNQPILQLLLKSVENSGE